MPDDRDGDKVTFTIWDKARVKAHCALKKKSMTDFINEAVQEKIQRDLLSPPKVIIVGAHRGESND